MTWKDIMVRDLKIVQHHRLRRGPFSQVHRQIRGSSYVVNSPLQVLAISSPKIPKRKGKVPFIIQFHGVLSHVIGKLPFGKGSCRITSGQGSLKRGRGLVLPQFDVPGFFDSPWEALPSLRVRSGQKMGEEGKEGKKRELQLVWKNEKKSSLKYGFTG